ncbi:hypothetical protein AYO44_14460 [Planctomycetaceae bacterium SCGC AG-212-F19]|nr:hypothetical protein AYO44_14460 [Planctomycetaceae bacterium SCGC AG-212-F19]
MRYLPGAVIGLLLAVGGFLAAEPNAARDHDRTLLKGAGLPTDAAGLVRFFQSRTVDAATQKRIIDLIAQLGSDDFSTREQATKELAKLGTLAEPFLTRAANDGDAEVTRRARECLAALPGPRARPDLIAAAARLLVAQNPPRTLETLLDYLPSLADEPLEEEIATLVAPLGLVDGKPHPAIIAAAQDKQAVRRLAATGPLARAGDAHRAAVRQLLADPDHRVRLFAAQALVGVRDKAGVPGLIALLGDGPLHLVWQAEDQLCRIAGDKAPSPVLDPGNAASRQKCRAAWDAWWKACEASIDLARLPDAQRLLGLTLICDFDGGPNAHGRVFEVGADGKERWKIDTVHCPADAHVLPTGRVLIAEHDGQRVTERTREGRVVWEHKVAGNPVSCQRLPNGNTFIATYTELLEVTREGKSVYTIQRPSSIFGAQKLPTGNILYIHSNGHIVEVKTDGTEVRSIPAGNTAGWASVELLPNGHFLVALYNANVVKEIDANGKEYLKCTVPQATFATRLSTGHTLTADTRNCKILEFDGLGKKVAELPTGGRPFCVRRR